MRYDLYASQPLGRPDTPAAVWSTHDGCVCFGTVRQCEPFLTRAAFDRAVLSQQQQINAKSVSDDSAVPTAGDTKSFWTHLSLISVVDFLTFSLPWLFLSGIQDTLGIFLLFVRHACILRHTSAPEGRLTPAPYKPIKVPLAQNQGFLVLAQGFHTCEAWDTVSWL